MILSTFRTTGAWTQQRITATGCDIPNFLPAYSLPPSRTKELMENLDFICLKKMLPVGLEISSSIRLNHTFDCWTIPCGVCSATRNWSEGRGNTIPLIYIVRRVAYVSASPSYFKKSRNTETITTSFPSGRDCIAIALFQHSASEVCFVFSCSRLKHCDGVVVVVLFVCLFVFVVLLF